MYWNLALSQMLRPKLEDVVVKVSRINPTTISSYRFEKDPRDKVCTN